MYFYTEFKVNGVPQGGNHHPGIHHVLRSLGWEYAEVADGIVITVPDDNISEIDMGHILRQAIYRTCLPPQLIWLSPVNMSRPQNWMPPETMRRFSAAKTEVDNWP